MSQVMSFRVERRSPTNKCIVCDKAYNADAKESDQFWTSVLDGCGLIMR